MLQVKIGHFFPCLCQLICRLRILVLFQGDHTIPVKILSTCQIPFGLVKCDFRLIDLSLHLRKVQFSQHSPLPDGIPVTDIYPADDPAGFKTEFHLIGGTKQSCGPDGDGVFHHPHLMKGYIHHLTSGCLSFRFRTATRSCQQQHAKHQRTDPRAIDHPFHVDIIHNLPPYYPGSCFSTDHTGQSPPLHNVIPFPARRDLRHIHIPAQVRISLRHPHFPARRCLLHSHIPALSGPRHIQNRPAG